ncbi:MAG: gluconate:H+ symporter [Terracidiphilus sp.]|nr:gluconate:H+ symporter [Terracidiphilus sp.]MDR3799581.1 gluconate:H+ symporter [Terracidiphilus sp.]
MSLLILALGIVLLFVLMIYFKLNAFLALIVSCVFIGVLHGMPLLGIVGSIEKGIGGTASLIIIIGLGAIIGRILTEVGAAQSITQTLIDKFGEKRVGMAVLAASFIIGITMFWEVAFVILMPILYSIAKSAKVSLLRLGVPLIAAITACHGFLPPHPGPVAVVGIFGANMGLTFLYGFIIAIPATLCGYLYVFAFRNETAELPTQMLSAKEWTREEMPSFSVSVFSALLPVVLILLGVIGKYALPGGTISAWLINIGSAEYAMLIATFFCVIYFAFGTRGVGMEKIGTYATRAFTTIGPIVFAIGGGAALKQVIVDSGTATYVADIMRGMAISPLFLAWLVAAVIRLAVGSATVTVFTASGIVVPLAATSGYSPELFVLAITAGSLFCDPPSDGAWWMAKEYFNIDIRQTLMLMSGTTTILSVVGLVGVLALSLII